jgi:hypothetical protein
MAHEVKDLLSVADGGPVDAPNLVRLTPRGDPASSETVDTAAWGLGRWRRHGAGRRSGRGHRWTRPVTDPPIAKPDPQRWRARRRDGPTALGLGVRAARRGTRRSRRRSAAAASTSWQVPEARVTPRPHSSTPWMSPRARCSGHAQSLRAPTRSGQHQRSSATYCSWQPPPTLRSRSATRSTR